MKMHRYFLLNIKHGRDFYAIQWWMQAVDDFCLDLPLLFKVHEIWSIDSKENN